ncbi:MAG: ABC transporter [Oscillospiraceae bacterium]|nr:ABC transporter [Oscillospiraceae bacterium]
MLAIYKKELRSYFTSAVGYVFIAAFLAVNGFIFSLNTIQVGSTGQRYDISQYYIMLLFVFSILIPLLTMKIFSDEKKLKTEQLLLTAPVGLVSIVTAKFLSAYTMFAGTYLVSCLNYYVLFRYGKPTAGVIYGHIIGILLIGAAFVAIGVFVSSLTENQISAAVLTITILLGTLVINFLNDYIDITFIRVVLSWISIYSRFFTFTYGIFDINACIYYVSIVIIFLFLTVRIYEKRRWE